MKKDIQKKISIIVPIYNVEAYIERCLNSLLNQTYNNIEIVLVDDGSTDNSKKICDSYAIKDDRIKVYHKENGGQSSARNLGLNRATGDLIGFIDSDDWIERETLEYLANLIEYNDADIANIRCRFVKSNDNDVIKKNYKEKVVCDKEGLEKLMYEAVVGIPGSLGVIRGLYKRDLIKDLRFVEGRINEDMVFSYEVYNKASKVVFSTRICYNYFMSPQSTTRGPLRKKELDLLWACDKLIELSSSESFGKIKEYVKIKVARSDFSLLAKAALYGVDTTQINKKKTIATLTSRLRKNWKMLMKSSIPLNRKIMITAFCCNYNLVSFPIKIYRQIR